MIAVQWINWIFKLGSLGVGEIERYKSIERSKCGRPHDLSDN
jgi:hypothetical protein